MTTRCRGSTGGSGLEQARERRPEVPFVFVSGTIGEDAATEAMKQGATDYVLKHRLTRLTPAVERALREAVEHAEYQRAIEAMRQSEHKYRELFECLGGAAFLADEQSGEIIETNRCAQVMQGRTRAEILGHKLAEFFRLDSVAPPVDAEVPLVSGGQLTRTDGISVAVEVRSTPLISYGRALVLRLCHTLNGPHYNHIP